MDITDSKLGQQQVEPRLTQETATSCRCVATGCHPAGIAFASPTGAALGNAAKALREMGAEPLAPTAALDAGAGRRGLTLMAVELILLTVQLCTDCPPESVGLLP